MFVAPHVPIVLSSLLLLWVSFVVITLISYVGVFGKGFPVDSSLCLYLIPFLPALASQGWISYLMWLVCSGYRTRGTWVDSFFPSAGRFLH